MSHPLYPKIFPFQQSLIATDDGHQLYVEQSGNANGIPVLYLHGGPGGGSNEHYRRYFDPEKYHIIQFDQRGCGRSLPAPSLHNNKLTSSVADIELIRQHLAIKNWLITGGSWGTTLALAYGIAHPSAILGFILRGIFLATTAEYQWLYHSDGVAKFFPEYYQDFISGLPKENQHQPLKGYHQILNSDNELAVITASKAWYLWEHRLSSLTATTSHTLTTAETHQALCMAKISSHYFFHHCDMPENYLLENLAKIQHLPAFILHGRYDMVCQLDNAYRLAQAWPNAQLQILPQAGHSGFEPQTADAFCKAANLMADFLLQKKQ